jgi:hypothetical protein
MYNTDIPSRAELPSSKQLFRSTLIAAASALVLLYTLVLPSEYGVDPTGIGRTLGLTDMGEIKARLAKEAAEDAAATQTAQGPSNAAPATAAAPPTTQLPAQATAPVPQPAALTGSSSWRDEMTFTLAPGEGTEVKLKMKEGETTSYAWRVQGGVVNFDTHGDAIGRSISYEKGRSVSSDEGELVAAFTGNHGWFWRNRGKADVTVILQTGGEYSDIKRVK